MTKRRNEDGSEDKDKENEEESNRWSNRANIRGEMKMERDSGGKAIVFYMGSGSVVFLD
jgi:hypothetical protein